MRGEHDLKMECLKLANSLGASKTITPGQVVPYAMEFFNWVRGPIGSARDLSGETVESGKLEELRQRFQR